MEKHFFKGVIMNEREKRAEIMTSEEYREQNFKEEKEDKETEKRFNDFWLKQVEKGEKENGK